MVANHLRLLRAARAPKPLEEALEEFKESKLKEGLRPNSLKAVIWEITRAVKELGPKKVPITENFRAWLLTITHRSGVIAPATSFRRRFNTIRPVAGFQT